MFPLFHCLQTRVSVNSIYIFFMPLKVNNDFPRKPCLRCFLFCDLRVSPRCWCFIGFFFGLQMKWRAVTGDCRAVTEALDRKGRHSLWASARFLDALLRGYGQVRLRHATQVNLSQDVGTEWVTIKNKGTANSSVFCAARSHSSGIRLRKFRVSKMTTSVLACIRWTLTSAKWPHCTFYVIP